jgi:cell division protein ZapA (FtsZ GTPase activity inhibitor)
MFLKNHLDQFARICVVIHQKDFDIFVDHAIPHHLNKIAAFVNCREDSNKKQAETILFLSDS